MCKELLENKSPVRPQTDKAGELPADLARANGHKQLAEILETWAEPPAQAKSAKWLHGKINRNEAKNALKIAANENAFVIRSSTNQPDTYVLDIKFKSQDRDKFRHYIIYRRGVYYQLNSGPLMASLEHLIDYYML